MKNVAFFNVTSEKGEHLATMHVLPQENGDTTWNLIAVEFPTGELFKLGHKYLDDKGVFIPQLIVRIGTKVDRAMFITDKENKNGTSVISIRDAADIRIWDSIKENAIKVLDWTPTITERHEGQFKSWAFEFKDLTGDINISLEDQVYVIKFGEQTAALPNTLMELDEENMKVCIRNEGRSAYFCLYNIKDIATLVQYAKTISNMAMVNIVDNIKEAAGHDDPTEE